MIKVIPLSDELRKAMIAKVGEMRVVNPKLIKILKEAKEIIDATGALPSEESPFTDTEMDKKIRFYAQRGYLFPTGILLLSPDGRERPSIHMRVSCNGQQWDWCKLQIETITFVF